MSLSFWSYPSSKFILKGREQLYRPPRNNFGKAAAEQSMEMSGETNFWAAGIKDCGTRCRPRRGVKAEHISVGRGGS